MKRLLVVVSTNRDMEPKTELQLRTLVKSGAGLIVQRGLSDVALARNLSLTAACAELRQCPERDLVLMLDDDMDFKQTDVVSAVEASIASGRPVSGAYCTKDGRIAARRDGSVWLTGLGFLAIPRGALLALEGASEELLSPEGCIAFCWSGPHGGRWDGEDYCLTRRLGNVVVAPLPIGHIKKATLMPRLEDLQNLLAAESLAAAE